MALRATAFLESKIANTVQHIENLCQCHDNNEDEEDEEDEDKDEQFLVQMITQAFERRTTKRIDDQLPLLACLLRNDQCLNWLRSLSVARVLFLASSLDLDFSYCVLGFALQKIGQLACSVRTFSSLHIEFAGLGKQREGDEDLRFLAKREATLHASLQYVLPKHK